MKNRGDGLKSSEGNDETNAAKALPNTVEKLDNTIEKLNDLSNSLN